MRTMQTKSTFQLVCFLLGMLFVGGMADSAQAQQPSHYYPARPTFSTYLLYRQFNATGVPNYYQYVRPSTQYRDFLTRRPPSTAGSRRQTLSVEQQVATALENQLRQRSTTGIGRPSVAAQFNDTSHFYPPTPTTRR